MDYSYLVVVENDHMFRCVSQQIHVVLHALLSNL